MAALLVLIVACDMVPASSTTGDAPVLSAPSTAPTTTIEPSTTVPSEATPIDVGPLTARSGHSVIWTGEELIVWGGHSGDSGPALVDGAAFNPTANTWRPLAESPLSPRAFHVAAWTGHEMLIVGDPDGAAYDPATDSWRTIQDPPVRLVTPNNHESTGSVWTGQELMLWSISSNLVAAYAPDLNTWRTLPSIDLPGESGVLRWTGDALYAFADSLASYPSDTALKGARLNQEGGWETMAPGLFSTDDLIVGADATLTVWTGDHFIAWTRSGTDGKTMRLTPSDGTWTETDPVPIHPCEGQGEPVQPGPLVTAFDSCDSSIAVLDPDTGSWSTSKVTGYPTARYTVWAGAELIHWGGGWSTVDAWRYTPGG